jgi:hypothetical protein
MDFLAEVDNGTGITPAGKEPSPSKIPTWPKLDGDARTQLLIKGRASVERKNPMEFVLGYDARTGKKVFEGTSRLSDRVGVPMEFTQNRNLALVLHHNHPDSRSLSIGDIEVLSRRGVVRTFAHGHDGSQFSAQKGANIGYLDRVKEVSQETTQRQIALLLRRGLHLPGFEAHLRNMAMHRAGVIEYHAKLDRRRSQIYYKEKAAIDAAVDEIALAIKRKLP